MKFINFLFILGILFSFSSCSKENVDNAERQKVIDDYFNIKRTNEVYDYTAVDEGKYACFPGTIDTSVFTKILNQVNYYRRFVGCSEVELDTNFNKQVQAFIVYSRANKGITTLDPNATCYSKEVADAWGTVISSSSYHTNVEGPVEHFMYASALATNRRWLLYPKLSKIGYGHYNTFFGIKVTGEGTENKSQNIPEYVAYPPKGFILQEMMPADWSFVVPNADVRYSTVTLKTRDLSKVRLNGKNLPWVDLAIKVDNTGWATHASANPLGEDPSILFEITGEQVIDDAYEDIDLEYEVTVQNVLIDGMSKDFVYKVTVIRKI